MSMNKDGIVTSSADGTRNSRSTSSLRESLKTTKRKKNKLYGEDLQPRGQILREHEQLVPWVMWGACLPSDDEFNGFPAALAVLHQDRHRILPTRQ